MKLSDHLFRLIKSLDKNEKGYFKKMAAALSGKSRSNYFLLFDFMDRQDEYDEQAVLKKFRKESFVRHLSVAKNYLYELILKTLRIYHEKNQVTAQLNNHLENAQLLFQHSLYEEAFASLKKARQQAEELNNLTKLAEISYAERRLYLEATGVNWGEKVEENIEDVNRLLNTMLHYNEIYRLYFLMLRFIRVERIVRTEEQRKYIDSIVQSEVLQTDYQSLGFEARVNYLMIHKIYHQLINEDRVSLGYMQQVVDLYRSNPKILYANPGRYINALNNFLGICMKQGDYETIDTYLRQLEPEISEYDDTAQMRLFEYRLEVLLHKRQFDQVYSLCVATIHKLKYHRKDLNPGRLLVMKYNCCLMFFCAGRYDEALDQLNDLLMMKNIEARVDIHAAARIFNIVVHYELGNLLLLESTIRSARHYLQTRETYYETEKIFLHHIGRLVLAADKAEQHEVLERMLQEIEQLVESNEMERNFQQTCNLRLWLVPKVEGITTLEYLAKTL